MIPSHDGVPLLRKRPGPKPRGRTVMPLTITVTMAQRTALIALADTQMSSISAIVRQFIIAGLSVGAAPTS